MANYELSPTKTRSVTDTRIGKIKERLTTPNNENSLRKHTLPPPQQNDKE